MNDFWSTWVIFFICIGEQGDLLQISAEAFVANFSFFIIRALSPFFDAVKQFLNVFVALHSFCAFIIEKLFDDICLFAYMRRYLATRIVLSTVVLPMPLAGKLMIRFNDSSSRGLTSILK